MRKKTQAQKRLEKMKARLEKHNDEILAKAKSTAMDSLKYSANFASIESIDHALAGYQKQRITPQQRDTLAFESISNDLKTESEILNGCTRHFLHAPAQSQRENGANEMQLYGLRVSNLVSMTLFFEPAKVS